jgi:hypothetical protein
MSGMYISLCNATGGLSLPSIDTLAVFTTQSTFLEQSFVYSDTRCCVQERLNNGVFCSRNILLWVSAAWKAIPESIIVRSFKKCCISNALDGSEDAILWENDGEDKDDSDRVMDNDSVMMTASLVNNKL